MKLANPTFGTCGAVLTLALLGSFATASAGCDTTDDGTDPTAGGTADAGGDSNEAGGSEGDDGGSEGGEDTTPGGDSDGETFDGLGCQAPTSCDGGTVTQWTRLTTEADMQSLMGVTAITNNLEISESEFECLDFLACLETIDGDLTIFANENLKSTSGIDAVTTITGNVSISNNAFSTLGGFNAVKKVNRFRLSRNDLLTSIRGFSDLAVIEDGLSIQDNLELEDISGLNNLAAVGESFVITQNPSLCLSKVNAIGAGLEQCGDADGDGQCDGSTSGNDEDC